MKIFNLNTLNSIKTRIDHTKGVTSLCVLNDGKLASGSDDNLIKIYNPNRDYNCELIIKLNGHNEGTLSLCVLNDSKLVSSHGDGTINIKNYNSFECLATLNGHQDLVNKVVYFPPNRINSYDKIIKIWDC